MPAPLFRSSPRGSQAWPGWVDALSSLVMVIIFLLMIFVLAQFYLVSTLTGREAALEVLRADVAERESRLNAAQSTLKTVRQDLATLAGELQTTQSLRDAAVAEAATLRGERDALAARIPGLSERADSSQALARELAAARDALRLDKDQIAEQSKEINSLHVDIKALTSTRDRLEEAVAGLTQTASAQAAAEQVARTALQEQLEQARDRNKTLEAERAQAEKIQGEIQGEMAEKILVAQKTIAFQATRLDELETARAAAAALAVREREAADAERALTVQGQQQITLLNSQATALRAQLARLNSLLEASETKAAAQDVQISELGSRLNAALAGKVEELTRYRSEFFGRLREVLGQRSEVKVAGDRFVFPAEVLFATGSAVLEEPGKQQLATMAQTILALSREFPPSLNWILRVDGHTDRRPIATSQFPSNWELSQARALAVVRFLTEQGLPASRLAAVGFGEFQPLDDGGSDEALARNRRIEIRLDQR